MAKRRRTALNIWDREVKVERHESADDGIVIIFELMNGPEAMQQRPVRFMMYRKHARDVIRKLQQCLLELRP